MKSRRARYKGSPFDLAAADDDTETVRGRVTVFDGITAVVKLNARGEAKHIRRSPSWKRVKHVSHVCGQSLDRVSISYQDASTIRATVKVCSGYQKLIGCDGCARTHSSTNKLCSANLRIKTFAENKFYLYSIDTHVPIKGQWARADEIFLPRSKVGTVTFVKR